MALTLTELFEKQSDSAFRNMVTVACWRCAKTLLAKTSPTSGELTMAKQLLTNLATPVFVIAAAVLIDDGTVDDAAIEAAVAITADKLIALEA